MDQLESIQSVLAAHGISHDPESILLHHCQGLMSSVYTIASSQGSLIVHYTATSPTREHFQQWQKLQPVSEFLRGIPGVPAAEVLLAARLEDHFIVVQKMLPGTPAGRIEMAGDGIVLSWDETPELHEQQLEGIIAAIHETSIEGFGELVVKDGRLRGEYDSWAAYLDSDVPFFLEGIAAADARWGTPPDTLLDDLRAIFARIMPHISTLERASLVNCDIMNPSNILIQDGQITGVVDWEWALAADPALEFAYVGPLPLAHYLAARSSLSSEQAREDFFKRIRLYGLLLHTMRTYSTSGDEDSTLFKTCRAQLQEAVAHSPALFKNLGM